MILSCKDIRKSFGINEVLKNVSFILEEKEKAAIAGVNGAGKTTLFKILTNELSADGGTVALAKGQRLTKGEKLGYLAQLPPAGEVTVYEEMLKVFDCVIRVEQRLRKMELSMSQVHGSELQSLMTSYERATHEFESFGGYEYKSRIRGVLCGLGFSGDEFSRPMATLSGGQKTRLSLAALLLREPEILLLDEPTNHLDLTSIEWLEEFLAGYPGSALIISHDRYFLDRIVTKVIEIENGISSLYFGNYTHYAQKKEEDREINLKHYTDQQKEIKRQEAVIVKLRRFNREKSIKRAESREKMLDRVERLEKPKALGKIKMSLNAATRSGFDVLTVDGIGKSFDGREVIRDVCFEIKRSEKVALIGPNGVGKTTLFKILMAEIPTDKGSYIFGHNVVPGYYDQEHENIDESKTVFNELSDSCPRLTVTELRNTLASFMFTGDEVNKQIKALSGGERGRVALLKLMLQKSNLLLLDEPTNHLDIYSREILEGALGAYDGTVLYISHDRYFISRTADKIIEMTPTGAVTYKGGYEYYLEKKSAAGNTGDGYMCLKTQKTPITVTCVPSGDEYRRKKQEESERRRAKGKLERIENEIFELEAEILRLDERLHIEAGADFELANELFVEKTLAQEKLIQLYSEWEELESNS